MSGPFKVGDVVVCISRHTEHGRHSMPVVGGVYKILSIDLSDFHDGERIGLAVRELDFAAYERWNPVRFRHLPKADETFTAQMRALKPKKVGV